MRFGTKRVAMVAAAAAAALVLAGCGSDGDDAGGGGGDGTLTLYNAQHESLTQAWAEAFTKETGIKVEMRNGSDFELANQIVQEGSGSPADVFLTENSPAMTLVENAGLFAAVDAATLAQVPDAVPARRPASGSASPPARRCSSTTPTMLPEARAADVDHGPGRARQWKGQSGASPVRRGLPGHRQRGARSSRARTPPRRGWTG